MKRNHHWVVAIYPDFVRYERVDYIPSEASSRVLADEIDGLTMGRAVKVLRKTYNKVTTFKSGVIICREEK